MTALEYSEKEGLKLIYEFDDNTVLCEGDLDDYYLYNSYYEYDNELVIEEFVIERVPKNWQDVEDIIANGVPNQVIKGV